VLGAQTDAGGWRAEKGTNLMTTYQVVRALQRHRDPAAINRFIATGRPTRRQPCQRPASANARRGGQARPTSAAASDCSTPHR
jgi:hypothetical protein